MMAKLFKCSLSLVLILSCAGCLKKPINLKPLTKESAHDSQTKQQVTVHTKTLSFDDQKEIFGSDAKQLAKNHIIPVQVTIENRSQTAWLLANQNISLKLLTIDEVNKVLFASKRWIPLFIFLGGLGLALVAAPIGCLFIPATADIAICLCHVLAVSIAVTGGILLTSSGIAIADGIVNHMSKNQMREYLKDGCNMEGLTITPYINASMLFFTKEADLPEKLNLLLVDKNMEKNTLPFELNL